MNFLEDNFKLTTCHPVWHVTQQQQPLSLWPPPATPHSTMMTTVSLSGFFIFLFFINSNLLYTKIFISIYSTIHDHDDHQHNHHHFHHHHQHPMGLKTCCILNPKHFFTMSLQAATIIYHHQNSSSSRGSRGSSRGSGPMSRDIFTMPHSHLLLFWPIPTTPTFVH